MLSTLYNIIYYRKGKNLSLVSNKNLQTILYMLFRITYSIFKLLTLAILITGFQRVSFTTPCKHYIRSESSKCLLQK
jgi:hypothetical protein